MEKKILKAVLEDEVVDGIEVKKGKTQEFDENMANYLLKAYSDRRELVEESKEDSKEEKKAEKKTAKKSK